MPIEKLRPAFTFTEDRLAELRAVVPEAFADGAVNWEALREALGAYLEDEGRDAEHFGLTWPGKRQARRLAAQPSKGTLIPAAGEGVDEATTRNLFIEGDNLEVLKLLQKSYAGRVKLIYIDPPYNTGKDFVYKDNFVDTLEDYLRKVGQVDESGQLLVSNTRDSGRFHSNWLNMMYPRLLLARQLLRDDGVILVSIDDNEVHNLRTVMGEVFGEENFIAQLVWEKGRKNDARLFSVGHEYIVIFARSIAKLRELNTVWREPKPGAQEIWNKYLQLRKQHGNNDPKVEKALQEWYRSLPSDHPSRALSRYKHIDKYGPWRDRDISWPGGGGPRYDVIHPVTKKPCKVPERGWGFATSEKMEEQIKLGLVVFRDDHTEPPFRKAHLRPVSAELEVEEFDEDEEGEGSSTADDVEVGMQVMGSYLYKQSQVAVKYLRNLFNAKLFNNPKDYEVLARLIRYITSPNSNDIIMDFFAGSGSTAEAVLQLNHQPEGGNRRFIVVQVPEPTPEKSPAFRAGYRTIAEIAKERIRRVIKRLRKDIEGKLDLQDRDTPEDLGFRVYKLGRSNYKAWQDYQGESVEELETFFDRIETPLVDGWQREHVLAEAMLLQGFPLDSTVTDEQGFKRNLIQRVESDAVGHRLFVCLDDQIADETIAQIQLAAEDVFICLDSALTDEAKLRLGDRCTLRVI